MVRFTRAAALLLGALFAARALAQGPQDDLLRNGGFETGGTHEAAQWDEIWPRQVLKTPPKFDRSKEAPHGGKACAVLTVPEAGGYCSFTQEIASTPRDAKSVHVEGWIDFTPDPRTVGAPTIMILFVDPSKPGDGGTVKDARLPRDAKGWTRVAFDAVVPAGATQWLVRCGMTGCGTARFDDVLLTASSKPVEAVTLLKAHGDYFVIESGSAAADPWIEFSFPFPFEGQTPLAIAISTDPPGRVTRSEIVPDQENRHLRVHVKPGGKDTKTTVRLDALVMVRDRPAGKAENVALAPRAKLPPDVARFFEKTPGIDADDKDVKAIAATVETDTMARAVEGVLEWMRANFKYEGGGDQGGRASLGRKYAVCTGHANLAASLFQAAGVPCRILGCLSGERLQEHYIVEVWAPGEGWRRVESTSKVFPIPDSGHLILHVAHPKFFRSGGNVPLHVKAADDCMANFKMGADTCWQGMSGGETVGVEPAEAAAAEKAARDAFAAWEKKPSTAAAIRLLPRPPKGAPPRAAAIAAEVEAFLGGK
jgi:hypothetical protein